MRIVDAISYDNRTSRILTEGYQELTESQKIYLGRWEKELWPLLEEFQKVSEANLTADEIQAIFKGAEKQSIASGDNKTLTGKVGSAVGSVAKLPVDIAKKVDAKINQLGAMAQKAGPIKNMDAKFEELKKKIGDSDSKVAAGVKRVSDWAKDNPGKASLAVGILTTVAAFAGGPAGGAAAGLVLRASKELLRGEKLSTAVGKSAKTAAYGALAGLAIQGLTDNMIDNIATGSEAEADAMMDAFEKANFKDAVDGAVADAGFEKGVLDGAQNLKMSGNINGFYYNYDLTMTADQVAQYKALSDAAANAETFSPEYYKAAGQLHGFLSTTQSQNESLTALAKTVMNIPKDALTSDQLDAAIAVLDNADASIEKIMDIGGPAAAAAQGALQTVDSNKEKMHNVKPISNKEKEQLELDLQGGGDKKENIDYEGTVEYLYEQFLLEKDPRQGELKLDNPNSLGAKAKRGLGKAVSSVTGGIKKGAGAVAGTVKSTAKELGQKVTVKKLNKAWEKMGKPTDAGSIYNLLSGQGISNDNIKAIGQEQNVALAPTKPADDQSAGDTKPSVAGTPKSGQPTGKDAPKDAPKDGPTIGNRMAGVKKQGHTWMGGQWVDDKTGKIGSTEKLGNPLITQLAQDIKAGGPDAVDQITKIIGTPDVAPVKKPTPKKTVVTPTQRKATKKRAVKDVDPTTPGAQKKYKPMAGNYSMSGNKKPNVQGTRTLQRKSKNPKA